MSSLNDHTESLRHFLIKAKLAGYATAGEGGERDAEDLGKEFRFVEGELKYRDRYYGFNPFSGEELVWLHSRPIWVMNYYSSVVSSNTNPGDVFIFLKQAMQHVMPNNPYRGPSQFPALPSLGYRRAVQSPYPSIQGEPTPQRGGMSKRHYELTPEGLRGFNEVKAIHDRMWAELPKLAFDTKA